MDRTEEKMFLLQYPQNDNKVMQYIMMLTDRIAETKKESPDSVFSILTKCPYDELISLADIETHYNILKTIRDEYRQLINIPSAQDIIELSAKEIQTVITKISACLGYKGNTANAIRCTCYHVLGLSSTVIEPLLSSTQPLSSSTKLDKHEAARIYSGMFNYHRHAFIGNDSQWINVLIGQLMKGHIPLDYLELFNKYLKEVKDSKQLKFTNIYKAYMEATSLMIGSETEIIQLLCKLFSVPVAKSMENKHHKNHKINLEYILFNYLKELFKRQEEVYTVKTLRFIVNTIMQSDSLGYKIIIIHANL